MKRWILPADAAGVIDELGRGMDDWLVGDRVVTADVPAW